MPADRPVVRQLRFASEDLQRFARASGDRNPLHLDPSFARRTPFGACIVHGALLGIGMLGAMPEDEQEHLGAARFWFSGPVMPGSACTVEASPGRRGWELRLTGRGKLLARALVTSDPAALLARIGEVPDPGGDRSPMRSEAARLEADSIATGQARAGEYSIGPELDSIVQDLGAARTPPALLEGLAWASYVVGMELPGLRSLFSGATVVAAAGGGAAGYAIHVRDHDERTGQLEIAGVLRDRAGEPRAHALIESFVRVPAAGPDPAALARAPTPGRQASPEIPADQPAAAVIGASRGFGAALTLALLARGYEVHAVYSRSQDSANELTRLAGSAAGRLHPRRLDAGVAAEIGELAGVPLAGLALNAALAPLAMGVTAGSAAELAGYVADSVRLAATPLGALLPSLREDGWILFSSSSALASPPRDWPHYVTAKAALEGLASWVSASFPSLRTVVVRPPAMRTEMTNTPRGRLAAAPTETIASWVAERLAGGELPAGLSILHPDPIETMRA